MTAEVCDVGEEEDGRRVRFVTGVPTCEGGWGGGGWGVFFFKQKTAYEITT